MKSGQGQNVFAVIIPNRFDRESIHLAGDYSHAPFPGSGKVTYTMAIDGFPLIASTNPLADLPSGVDWQRLAAEE